MAKAVALLLVSLCIVQIIYIFVKRKEYQKMEQELNSLREMEAYLKENREKESQLIIMNQKIKYDVLQNQINPHFLYNTLENIRGQAIIGENYLIADMTEALARYFRYNIIQDGDIVNLSQEIENIKTYIQIQRYRFRERIVFQIYSHVAEEFLKTCKIPKMTLQPIVENAIYYGVENKVEQGHIDVHIDIIGGCVSIIVSDDGQGMSEEVLHELNTRIHSDKNPNEEPSSVRKSKGNGIALTNINKRIQLLYGEEYGVHISSVQNVGTEVGITFPFVRTESGDRDEN